MVYTNYDAQDQAQMDAQVSNVDHISQEEAQAHQDIYLYCVPDN
jgi:hypothetical protein